MNGCGFSLMPEDYRVYLFNQSVLGMNELMPFFYSSEYFFNQSYNWDDTQNGDKNMFNNTELVNADEWKQHTHYKGSLQSISAVIYHLDYKHITFHSDSILKQYPFLKHLLKSYKKEYEYLLYAKKCELIYEETDPWGLLPDDNKYILSLADEGNSKLKNHLKPFLQLRYAYQLTKISFYHPGIGRSSVQEIYDQFIKPVNLNSWLKASARFYVNETNYINEEERQYRLSLSFDESIDKKFRCVQLFDRKHYLQIMKRAKNNQERANIYVMYELQNPGRSLVNLKKIYKLDSDNEYLDFLLAREINKIEDWLLTPELTTFQPSIIEYQYDNDSLAKLIDIKSLSNKTYVNELKKLVNDIIKTCKPEKVAHYHLLASNVCLLLKQKHEGYDHLIRAESCNPSLLATYQILFNKIALQMDGNTSLTDTLKKQILNFDTFHKKNPNLLIRQQSSLSQLYLFIGCRLINAGDVANGILFCSKTNRPLGEIGYWKTKSYLELLLEKAKPKHYDEIISLIDKPHKTTFEHFLLKRTDFTHYTDFYSVNDTTRISKNVVLDYKSMYYVQQDMLDSALQCVNKIDAGYWNQYPYNLFKCFPFISGNSTDYQSNNDFYSYNKRQYLQRMVDVKYLIENNIGDVSKHYFALANGYFNMSYHGNYWIMNMPYKLSDEVNNSYYAISNTNKQFLDNYYGCKQAERYFLKAFEYAKDTALAAVCISKAGLCNENLQQINWRLTAKYDYKAYKWRNELKIKPDTYKQLFIHKYKDNDFYEDYVSNCYYLEHVNSYYY
jgi:hypothetical protein